jgi:2-keto-4-pentenoate hydratase
MAITLPADPVDQVASSLLDAWRGGGRADDSALRLSLTSELQAYAVQDRVAGALGGPEGCPRYWKAGAASRDDPVRHSPLPAAGIRHSGAFVEVSDHVLVEAEVALRMGRDVTAQEAQSLSAEAAAALVDGMCVSIELLSSRWASGRNAPPLLRIADFLSHGALVLGTVVPFRAIDWMRQECRVSIGGAVSRSFRGTLGIGEPGWILPAWLGHATRNGAYVARGTIVSTGTWCGVLAARPGELVTAEFPGIGQASVRLARPDASHARAAGTNAQGD